MEWVEYPTGVPYFNGRMLCYHMKVSATLPGLNYSLT